MVREKIIGNRRAVYEGKAKKTRGGLTKKDLFKNKRGKIVSLKKRKQARQVKYNPLLAKKLLVPKGSKNFGVQQMYNKKTAKNSANNRGKKSNKKKSFSLLKVFR